MDVVDVFEISGFRSETTVVRGVQLHYWVGGNSNGTPVLLWHGFLGAAHSWYKVMPMMAEAGYAVLAPDMRGYGSSDKPSGNEGYDGRALAEEFRSLVKQLDFGAGKKLLLVGFDMGAPPALLWAGAYPDEVLALAYLEEPILLEEFLTKMIVYTPDAAADGSMWWWLLPLAKGVPERLIVGREREFLTWFYQGATADPRSISEASTAETLRTFKGVEGVLGSLGVYRAAFTTVEQTALLKKQKVMVPVLGIGGEESLGRKVSQMLSEVAEHVMGKSIPICGHFIAEEQPAEFMKLFQEFVRHLD